MKNLSIFMMLLALPVSAQQQETLIKDGFSSGGYGGPMLSMTEMNGRSAVLAGGRGGWIVNHVFVLGGGGYGLTSDIKAGAVGQDGRDLYLEAGFGGVMLEYYFRPQKLLHFSVQSFLGGGNVSLRDKDGRNDWHDENEQEPSDEFFFCEPGVTLNLNVTTYMRLGAGFSYRYVSGVDLEPLTNSDLRGVSFNVFLNFGSF